MVRLAGRESNKLTKKKKKATKKFYKFFISLAPKDEKKELKMIYK